MISEVMSYEVEAKNEEEFDMLKEGRDSFSLKDSSHQFIKKLGTFSETLFHHYLIFFVQHILVNNMI